MILNQQRNRPAGKDLTKKGSFELGPATQPTVEGVPAFGA